LYVQPRTQRGIDEISSSSEQLDYHVGSGNATWDANVQWRCVGAVRQAGESAAALPQFAIASDSRERIRVGGVRRREWRSSHR
jgi:hypothetical protein